MCLPSLLESILRDAQKGDTGVIWNSNYREYISIAFRYHQGAWFWNGAPLPDTINDFLATNPGEPIVEGERYALFSGSPAYNGNNQGLLWIDCESAVTRSAFVALVPIRRGRYCLVVHKTEGIPMPGLPPQLLSSMHRWLRSRYNRGTIVSLDVHGPMGHVYSLDPHLMRFELGSPGVQQRQRSTP